MVSTAHNSPLETPRPLAKLGNLEGAFSNRVGEQKMFHRNGNTLEKSGNLDFLMNESVLGAVNQVGNPAEGL